MVYLVELARINLLAICTATCHEQKM
jgi:hypothetical protein